MEGQLSVIFEQGERKMPMQCINATVCLECYCYKLAMLVRCE